MSSRSPSDEKVGAAQEIHHTLRKASEEVHNAAEVMDEFITTATLDGKSEAKAVREVLERAEELLTRASEQLDAYQERYSGP